MPFASARRLVRVASILSVLRKLFGLYAIERRSDGSLLNDFDFGDIYSLKRFDSVS
jgi:hypothetical protein